MTAVGQSEGEEVGWQGALLDVVNGMRGAVLRFPVVVLFLVPTTIQANLYPSGVEPFLERFGLSNDEVLASLAGGTLAALAAVLFGEARELPPRARALLSLVAGAATASVMILAAPLHVLQWSFFLAIAGLVPVLPFVGRGSGTTFWMFAFRMAVACLLGVLALLLLAGGISAIFGTLTALFGFLVLDDLHEHVWLSVGFFAAPLFALGQMPHRFDEEPGPDTLGFLDRGLRALGDFAAVPLLILVTAILHIYALKIVVTQEVPQGVVGWLVPTYGFCVFAVLLLLSACFDGARAPSRFFLRFWPLVLPVPLVLLFYVLIVRVGEYGLTPGRYLLGLFAAAAAVVLVLQVPARTRGDIRLVAAVPVFLLLLGSFGPQGAVSLSLDSQAARFRQLVANQPVEGDRHREALATLRFLRHRDALGLVAPAGTDLAGDKRDAFERTAKAWSLNPDFPTGSQEYIVRTTYGQRAIPLDGFDTGFEDVDLRREWGPRTLSLLGGTELILSLEVDAFVVTRGDRTVRFPVGFAQAEAFARIPGDEPAMMVLEAGSRRIGIAPKRYHIDLTGKKGLRRVSGLILLRRQDWQ